MTAVAAASYDVYNDMEMFPPLAIIDGGDDARRHAPARSEDRPSCTKK
ncbi:MAG: hypothetical protein J0I21_03695 [Alphaproteobacteria bacterium]|nr:hypothetical protein [Alphaproteobacteria bacterium]